MFIKVVRNGREALYECHSYDVEPHGKGSIRSRRGCPAFTVRMEGGCNLSVRIDKGEPDALAVYALNDQGDTVDTLFYKPKTVVAGAATLLAILALSLLASCASIFESGPDVVSINTHPPGASVSLDGDFVGESPCQLTVRRKAGGMLRITKEGFHPVEMRLPTRTNATIILNGFLGYLMPLGLLVDLLGGNGSSWISPNTIALAPVEGGS